MKRYADILLIRVLALFDQGQYGAMREAQMAYRFAERKLSITLKILLGLEAALDLGLFIYCALVGHREALTLRPWLRLTKVSSDGRQTCRGNDYLRSRAESSIGIQRHFMVSKESGQRTVLIPTRATPMVYGLILFSLALYKASIYWKFSSGFKGLHLVRVLIRDQVIYYGL